ncbi:CDC42 small effector protein 1 isoform X4 [Hyla sarda]|uniref:CDC42 small effector protein 1 isoform X4 n=1 Tax=Hyla sarda TaxID=327740 RepID=UPI0024C2A6BF|nr:CDC42 small effector protein 1 isoform X4 [Hyla sarda]
MGKKKKEVRDRACAERLLLRKKNGRETGLMIYLKSLQRSYLLAGGQWSQRAYTYTARIHHEDSRIQLIFCFRAGTTPRWGDQLHCNFPPGAEKTRRTTGGPRALPGSPKPEK